jgi:hypothetical protein
MAKAFSPNPSNPPGRVRGFQIPHRIIATCGIWLNVSTALEN